jgi:hypothetical protein
MKPAGVLMLMAGWGLVLAALNLLKAGAGQNGFVFAGIAVEIVGLAVALRAK